MRIKILVTVQFTQNKDFLVRYKLTKIFLNDIEEICHAEIIQTTDIHQSIES